jgi:hypothetical protein
VTRTNFSQHTDQRRQAGPYLLSAKGAAFTASLGQRPSSVKKISSALKARFIYVRFSIIIHAMPQSLSKVILHLTFSTKNREPWLDHACMRTWPQSAATSAPKLCAWAV